MTKEKCKDLQGIAFNEKSSKYHVRVLMIDYGSYDDLFTAVNVKNLAYQYHYGEDIAEFLGFITDPPIEEGGLE